MKFLGVDVEVGVGMIFLFCKLDEQGGDLGRPYNMMAFVQPGEVLRWGNEVHCDNKIPLPSYIRTENDFLELMALIAALHGLIVEPTEVQYPIGPAYRLVRRQ